MLQFGFVVHPADSLTDRTFLSSGCVGPLPGLLPLDQCGRLAADLAGEALAGDFTLSVTDAYGFATTRMVRETPPAAPWTRGTPARCWAAEVRHSPTSAATASTCEAMPPISGRPSSWSSSMRLLRDGT